MLVKCIWTFIRTNNYQEAVAGIIANESLTVEARALLIELVVLHHIRCTDAQIRKLFRYIDEQMVWAKLTELIDSNYVSVEKCSDDDGSESYDLYICDIPSLHEPLTGMGFAYTHEQYFNNEDGYALE